MRESVSVIVPTHNSAATLPTAIESISLQNWTDMEVIVVDDGSSDETPTIIRNLAAENLRAVRQERSGPAAARNRAIAMARGKWVAFLDADDRWLAGKLDAQFNNLRKEPSHCFVFADSVRQTPDGTQIIHKPRNYADSIFADLLLGPMFELSTMIMRRDCFDRIGLFTPELRTGEDWDMWLRLSAFFQGCYVPEALVVYQVSGDPNKYPLDIYEKCQMRILDRLFSNREIMQTWPLLPRRRGRIYSWHMAMLAKSYLFRGQRRNFARLAASSIRSHPLGLYFLARSWKSSRHWPNLAGTSRRQTVE